MIEVKEYYVYVLYRWNYTPMYVGMGRNDRWLWHESSNGLVDKGNKHKVNSIKKTLRILGEVPKIKLRVGLTRAEAGKIEIMLIKAIGRYPNGLLVNRTAGGEGVSAPSPDAKRKMIAPRLGKPMYPNVRKHFIDYWIGRSKSEEQKEKISTSLTGYKRSEEEVRKSAEKRRGAVRTEEACQKMREAALKRCQSAEF